MGARAIVLAVLFVGGSASGLRDNSAIGANPIRKVVQLLKAMQAKVAHEGKKEEEIYQKFLCYCETGNRDLSSAITNADTKIPQVTSSLQEAEASKKETDADIAKAKEDRAEGKEALATATALRKKEATAFAKLSDDANTNLSALRAATQAIEKGMGGVFLQTTQASVLRKLSVDMEMSSADRDMLTAFLAQGQGDGYAPNSGDIVGILKELSDTVAKDLSDATSFEARSIADHDALAAAKTKEIEALDVSIESNLEKSGKLALDIVALQEDIDDTSKTLAQDKKFFAILEKGCAEKQSEWEARSKMRAEELRTLHETIQILNSDDALEIFKKALPAPSLLETTTSIKAIQSQALDALNTARHSDGVFQESRMSLIALALRGGAPNFDKVIQMIDKVLALLCKEQATDDLKRATCLKELDAAEDEKKALDNSIADVEKAIAVAEESVATLAGEIATLLQGIQDLDASVKEATETRQEENALYKKTLQEDIAAKDILKMAKNRLAQFYNPKLYKPPAKAERSAMGRIYESETSLLETAPALVEVRAHVGEAQQHHDDDGRARYPRLWGATRANHQSWHDFRSHQEWAKSETWEAYKASSDEHGGVVAMLDLLIGMLDKEMAAITTDEKESQKEYEELMQQSADKRMADTKSMEQKVGQKASTEADLLWLQQQHKDKSKELYLKERQIKDLHLDCDWLLANYEVRKQARASEMDSLNNAKAVLSGADSLVQLTTKRLRGM